MHICCRKLQCVLEALLTYRALRTDGSCRLDVANILVAIGKHEVRLSTAISVGHPC